MANRISVKEFDNTIKLVVKAKGTRLDLHAQIVSDGFEMTAEDVGSAYNRHMSALKKRHRVKYDVDPSDKVEIASHKLVSLPRGRRGNSPSVFDDLLESADVEIIS